MSVAVPDHFAPNIGGALVERGSRVMKELGIIPAYLHQYAEAWEVGLRYGGRDESFWLACANHEKSLRGLLRKNHLIDA